MEFAKFMATGAGRTIRVAFGLALIATGYAISGAAGLVLGLVGAVPAAAGIFNFCLISPLLHAPFWGRESLTPRLH